MRELTLNWFPVNTCYKQSWNDFKQISETILNWLYMNITIKKQLTLKSTGTNNEVTSIEYQWLDYIVTYWVFLGNMA
jgi:hypothetical protein